MFGEITSANIVGYSNETTKSDQQFVQFTPAFVDVDDEDNISLKNLNFVPSRGDNIQMFDTDGNNTQTLEYRRRGKSPNYEFYWVYTDEDGEETEVTDFKFKRGMSFWFATKDEVPFTQSGAVCTKDVVYDIPGDQAFVQAGNSRPVALKLSDIQFGDIQRGDNLQMFDTDGNNTKTLEYRRRGKSPNYEFYWVETVDGDETEIDPAEYEIKPGESFWFCLKNEQKVKILGLKL